MVEAVTHKETQCPHIDVSYDNGYSFGWGIRMVAIVGVLFGVGVMYFGGFAYILGPIFIITGGFAATSWVGTEISYDEHLIRDFHSAFWRKSGRWVTTDAFRDICILKLGKKQSGEDALGQEVNKVDMSRCEVYLMTHDHRKRILVKRCDSLREAVDVAEETTRHLDKPLVPFNPTISAQSAAKRR